MILGLDQDLLLRLWPEERLVIGLRTSKELRQRLKSSATGLFYLKPELYVNPELAESIKQDLAEAARVGQRVKLHMNGGWPQVLKARAQCQTLEEIRFRAPGPDAEDKEVIEGLWELVSHCPHLTNLDLGGERRAGNHLNSNCGILLSHAMVVCTNLTRLDVSSNKFNSIGVWSLSTKITSCSSLTYLDLRDNLVDPDATESLARHLPALPSLSHLDLSSNTLRGRGAKRIGAMLPHCASSLKFLGMGDNAIWDTPWEDGPGPLEALAAGLAHCTKLERLDLHDNGISEVSGLEELGEALKQLKQLKTLDLGANPLGPEGARIVADFLPGCSSLTYLNLRSASIGDEGISAMMQSLRQCTRLSELNLSRCRIRPQGITALAETLTFLPMLKKLNLRQNESKTEGALALSLVLPKCSIQDLDLSGMLLQDEGTGIIAEVLPRCSSFQILNLESNRVTNSGAEKLAEFLGGCHSLKELGLLNNEIDRNGIIKLHNAIKGARGVGVRISLSPVVAR